jgi:(1->4)-alpha-D-glucan 1-alpha-D-glucosylmutase
VTAEEPPAPPRVPTATYRVQVRPGFGFDDVAAVADHVHALGASHVYLSPILQPAPGSQHGYDVVDHSRLNTEAGGRSAFDRMAAALRELGLSAVADVVPNHMAVPTPVRLNHALWSVLRDGPGSPFARWFDVDWTVPDRAVLMPVLAERIGTVLASGQLTVDRDGPEPVLRYFTHEFPIRPGTEDLPLEELVDRQWYRLAWWRVADDELNYRRFFDVDTLAAVRVELPAVFDATHALLLELVADGTLTGLRIDHPDGLADPRGYLRRLAVATGGVWVVVEKILLGDEQVPADWPCAGTTGYESLHQVGGLFVDSAATGPLTSLLTELTGEPADFARVEEEGKRDVLATSLYAEVQRLTELLFDICREDIALRDHTRRHLQEALIELLVAFDRYRAYVVLGEPASAQAVEVLRAAAGRAAEHLPDETADALALVVDLALARPSGKGPRGQADRRWRDEFAVRFQQTCGPVMAKGVEDTAFYRWHRFVAANEVGGDPSQIGVAPDDFHAFTTRALRSRPAGMTTLSTHDTKRSEDVRARLAAATELSAEWGEAARAWMDGSAKHRSGEGLPDASTVYLMWQTLVGTWRDGPIAADRLRTFLAKATREAKTRTSWTSPDPAYDEAVAAFVDAVVADAELMDGVGRFSELIAGPARVAVLGQKLVQLAMPGVPDVYQGCELVDLSLVDPDNRRDVDFADRRARLARLDAGHPPADLDDEKLLVTSRTLRLRREHPDWFVGPSTGYAPIPTSTGNAVAFARGVLPATTAGPGSDAEDSAGPGLLTTGPLPLVGGPAGARAGDESGEAGRRGETGRRSGEAGRRSGDATGGEADAGAGAQVVAVATRLPVALARRGGWGEHTLTLPEGRWRDVFSGVIVDGGSARLAAVLTDLPVALLLREPNLEAGQVRTTTVPR